MWSDFAEWKSSPKGWPKYILRPKFSTYFGLSRYLDQTFAWRIGSAKVKSQSEVTHCSRIIIWVSGPRQTSVWIWLRAWSSAEFWRWVDLLRPSDDDAISSHSQLQRFTGIGQHNCNGTQHCLTWKKLLICNASFNELQWSDKIVCLWGGGRLTFVSWTTPKIINGLWWYSVEAWPRKEMIRCWWPAGFFCGF